MSDRVYGGRYQVQDKIGTGGMAVVYRGVDQVLGRTVAIKTMLPQYASDESFAARFKQEAQAAAALQSPYIVSIFDWGKDGDTYYIIMEYLRGTDLKSGIRKHGALDCRKVAQIGSQICQALSVAHRHDIIHRDIKPQNIMVQPDGNIKVMDFGIARAKNSHLTTDNSVLGTAHYVSPEQTQGKELGPTSDLYSLGIVMYEAATGQVPFDGEDAISVALKQVNDQPVPPSRLNPKVDASLEGIILKCMQKNPEDRFQTAAELYRVLREYLAGHLNAVSEATASVAAAGMAGATATAMLPANNTQALKRSNEMSQATMRATEQARQRQEAQRKKNRKRGIVIGVVLAVLAIALIALLATSSDDDVTKKVPNLVGLTQQEAFAEIDDSNFFDRGDVTEEYSDDIAEGVVMDQDPTYGTEATEGTEINLVVSKGPEPAQEVTVPDLTNMSVTEAEAALTELGLIAKAGDSVYDDDVEAGNIAQQEPAAGSTLTEGQTVTYHISKGTEDVEVPDVTGETEESATKILEAKGFEVTTENWYSDEVESGYVISTDPTAGTKLEKGETVTIRVSIGTKKVSIPDVTGASESSARTTLQNAGFAVSTSYEHSDTVSEGYVIWQSPSGSAESGTTVTIGISQGPESTTTTTGTGDDTGGDAGGDTGGTTGDGGF